MIIEDKKKDLEFDRHQVTFEDLSPVQSSLQSVPPASAAGHPSPWHLSQQSGALANRKLKE